MARVEVLSTVMFRDRFQIEVDYAATTTGIIGAEIKII